MNYTYADLVTLHQQKRVTSAALERATDWLKRHAFEGQNRFCEPICDVWANILYQIGIEEGQVNCNTGTFTGRINTKRLIKFLTSNGDYFRNWLCDKMGVVATEPSLLTLLPHHDLLRATVHDGRFDLQWQGGPILEKPIKQLSVLGEELRQKICVAIESDLAMRKKLAMQKTKYTFTINGERAGK